MPMKGQGLQRNRKRGRILAGCAAALMVAGATAGCTAYDPQGAAQQYAPSYYNQSYDQLSAEQKMQLEDHLSNQSNQAWRTSAQVASSIGHLAQGTGILLFAARH
jgi:phosphoglucomutase